MKGRRADDEDAAVDVADVGAADQLDQFPERTRMTDMLDPLFAKPNAGNRNAGQPGGNHGTVGIGLDGPDDPVAHFVHRIDGSKRNRHDDEGDDADDGDGGRKRAVAVHGGKQPAIDRPAGKADDDGGQNRDEETVEKVNAGKKNEDQHPAGSRHRSNEGMARNRGVPEKPWLHGEVFSFAIAQLHQ
ncbi:hypothetical protein D9M70_445510 [compost metagenome]